MTNFDYIAFIASQKQQEAKPTAAQDYIDEMKGLSAQCDKDLVSLRPYTEYVDALARQQRDKDKITEKFQNDVNSLRNRLRRQIERTTETIYMKRYPLLSSSDAQEKLQGTIEYNTAVQFLSQLPAGEYPLAQVKAYISANRFDLASALIDESLNRPTVGLESIRKRDAFQKQANEFYRNSGVMDLMVQKLELQTAEKVISNIIASRFTISPQDKILLGLNEKTVQSIFETELAKLNS